MAKVQFKTYTPNEIVLFPSNLGERIPKDHPVRLLSRIVDAMNWNIQYMWLSGNQHPSSSTINRFRSEHMKDCVNSLFIQVVKIMVALGQVSLGVQYIDGTKIESVANKYTFVWKKATLTNKAKLEERIKSVLR